MNILPTDLDDRRIRDQIIPKRLTNLDGHDEENAPRGIYLQLLHGRDDPDEDMDDWGFSGPKIGPFDWAHFTYNNAPNLGWGKWGDGNNGEVWLLHSFTPDACFLMPPNSLCRCDDMLYWNGAFYGDWELVWR